MGNIRKAGEVKLSVVDSSVKWTVKEKTLFFFLSVACNVKLNPYLHEKMNLFIYPLFFYRFSSTTVLTPPQYLWSYSAAKGQRETNYCPEKSLKNVLPLFSMTETIISLVLQSPSPLFLYINI